MVQVRILIGKISLGGRRFIGHQTVIYTLIVVVSTVTPNTLEEICMLYLLDLPNCNDVPTNNCVIGPKGTRNTVYVRHLSTNLLVLFLFRS